MNEKLSVIICTYNRKKYLKYALESLVLQTQTQEYFEVLIIDNNSRDNTKEIFEQFKNKLPLKYFLEKKQGLSYARNRGIKEAKCDFIAFLDDDAKANKDWVKQALKVIKKSSPDIFGGPIYPYYESKKPKWFKDSYEIRENGKESRYLKKGEYISGSNIFFKKNVFQKIGFFNPEYGMKCDKVGLGEETELQMIANKKGIKRFYEPSLFVYHLTPKYKMRVIYFVERSFATQVFEGKLLKKEKILKKVLSTFMSILRTFIVFFFLFLIFFRSRKKYPYWQNYFVEKIAPKILSFVKIKGLLF